MPRPEQVWSLPVRRRCLSILSALLLAGCGGNGSHHSSTTPTPPETGERVGPRISIAWPARTRNFPAPGYANAARIVFPNAGESNGDAAQIVTRPAGDAAVTQEILLDYAVRPGNHLVLVEFLIDPGVSFALATASVNLKVNADGTLSNLDGSPLGTVSYGSQFTSLHVWTEGTLEVGTTTKLYAWATVSGGVIAFPPNSAQFTLDSGSSFASLGANETITGIAPGDIVVTAKIDEVTSSTTLTVSPSPIAARPLLLGTNDLITDPSRNSLFAALGSTVSDSNVVVRIDPARGTIE